MPSFFSKVFARKGQDKEASSAKRASIASLLEGKFEAVSPPSPEARNFAETAQQPRDKDKDAKTSLFRPRSRPTSPPSAPPKPQIPVPRLTLNLPVPKEERSRALGVVFEGDPNDISMLPDSVVGERRLNPLETLLLVKACSAAIVERGGLETLGVMHPHWYSASPDVQRKLISLFILSLTPRSPITTLSPTPTSPSAIFNTELEYTRSPHDIAAVLRWALRHLRLDGESFGGTPGQWEWYTAFLNAERTRSWPTGAFSDILVPKLPAAHLQLLVATLEIVSSLAAHSEHNGISGSKLSKFFGLWLLTTQRSEASDDWVSFYSRWERAGRVLEHLFLAYIRDEMNRRKMPLRLSELTKGYPYSKDVSAEVDILPRPRLSTRIYDALYVRLETPLPDHNISKPKQHPLRIIADAFKSELAGSNEEYDNLWETIRRIATSAETEDDTLEVEAYPTLSRVFGDETIRLLSLIPADNNQSNALTLVAPSTTRPGRPSRRRSISLTHHANGTSARGNGTTTHGLASPKSPTTDASSPTSPKDWTDFSTAGFDDSSLGLNFAATLFDNDVEVTTPPARKPSRRHRASPDRARRSSVDNPNPNTSSPSPARSPPSRASVVGLTKVDEAFIDFWSDGLVDPVAADWPSFVVCQLKPLSGVAPVGWLVIEQTFSRPPPPQEPAPTPAPAPTPLPPNVRRASSPRPSLRSEASASARKSSTFAAGTRKRFSFFSANSRESVVLAQDAKAGAGARRKKAKTPLVGEMGEIEERTPRGSLSRPPAVPAKDAAPAGLGLTGVDAVPAPPSEPAPPPPPAPSAPNESPAPAAVQTAADAPVPVQEQGSAQSITIRAPELGEATSPISLTDTPTAADFPPVPVVETRSVPASPAPVEKEEEATIPLESVPVSAEEPMDRPVSEPEVAPISADAAEEKELPPAPESVVLSGETPGPQMALDTSEPAALALAEKEAEAKEEVADEPLAVEAEAPQHTEAALEKETQEMQESVVDHTTDAQPREDTLTEAAGAVVEHIAAAPVESSDAELGTVPAPTDVVVSAPRHDAVRGNSSSAEVVLAAALPAAVDEHSTGVVPSAIDVHTAEANVDPAATEGPLVSDGDRVASTEEALAATHEVPAESQIVPESLPSVHAEAPHSEPAQESDALDAGADPASAEVPQNGSLQAEDEKIPEESQLSHGTEAAVEDAA